MEALSVMAAKTHPPEYRIHKYWSRKPHNIVRSCVQLLLPQPGVVVDPCCGSGVVLREAALLGHETFGSDVNPVATELSELMLDPPDPEAFHRATAELLDWFDDACASRWNSPTRGDATRYVVHTLLVACRACGQVVAGGHSDLNPSPKVCPSCAKPVRFNLEWLAGTQILAVSEMGRRELVRDTEIIAFHTAESERRDREVPAALSRPFAENRRILAFAGMSASSLFTPRNLDLLTLLADRIEGLPDPRVRRAAMLMLTASVAQCSRLIAFRNNMTTGGPAWSVPGFWVPPIHLETNPAVHMRARLRRFRSALEPLAKTRPVGSTAVHRVPATKLLENLKRQGVQADLVFLDPPYGGSVPFLEFSAIWNAFLGEAPNDDEDMSVSDRMPTAAGWEHFRHGIHGLLSGVEEILAPTGRVLITFNNHDLRAWKALLTALYGRRLACDEIVYQIPAVVSSKAAFHPKSSYVSDLWAVWSRRDSSWAPSRDLAPVLDALERCAVSRDGKVAPNLVNRTLAIAWMRHNIDVSLLTEWDALVASLFRQNSDGLLEMDMPTEVDVPRVADIALEAASEILRGRPCSWPELYESISERCLDIGMPDPGELRELLADKIHFAGQRCLAARVEPDGQLALFS